MLQLLPMEDAPRVTGKLLLSYWGENPVFITWFPPDPVTTTVRTGIWPFQKKQAVTADDGGWRVMSWSPRLGWGVNGNCAPFTPPGWVDPVARKVGSIEHQQEKE